MGNPIDDIQKEIVEEFSLFDDWNDKYAYIIELGRKLETLAEEHKTESNIIKGCQSRVWLIAEDKDGVIHFTTDSDAIIVKGLIYLLIKALSNQKAEDIVNADLYFIDEIGMTQHLSQTRSNGLAAMLKQMKLYAYAFQAKRELK